jgi:hypothetical protein
VVVFYSAACLPLWFPQPEGIARERKPHTSSAPPPPPSLGDDRPGNRRSATRPVAFSTVTADDLEALVADGLLRPLSGDPRPEWMVPPSGAASSPPSGYVLSFVSFHERGFRVPASCFMRAILHFYGVELHNLNPKSIAQAAIFVAVCEGFLGIDPHWDLWTHLFSAEPFASTTGEKRVCMAVRAGGCILHLTQARAQQYIPAILVSSNKGWQRRWFYLWNDDGRLPSFSQRVVTAAGSNWRYGAPRERQKNLQPLLEALQELRDGGLTAAGVVAASHRRRVLPMTERRLLLSEMAPRVDLEGLQMSSVPLPTDDLHRWVTGMVGRLDVGALTQPSMRPERGCISLVSVRSFFLLVLDCPWFSQPRLPSVSRSWGFTSLLCHRSWRTRWTEPRGGLLRRRRTQKRLGPASGCGLGMPWRGVVGSRRGTGS